MNPYVLFLVVTLAGLGSGLIVGRWWALATSPLLGLGTYEILKPSEPSHSDIPFGLIAIAFAVWAGVFAAVGVVIGLFLRHRAKRFARPS